MKTTGKFLTIALALTLSANVLFAQAKSDYDKNVDFTKYSTFTFLGWQEESDKQINEFDRERILQAFKNELNARGLTRNDDNPDVAITLFLVFDQKTSITAYSNYNGGMGYGAGRWGWGMGMGSSTTSYSEDDYLEGTLVIDFYDVKSKELVFQGIMTKTVMENPKNRDSTIPKAINKLMKTYPVKPAKKK